MIHYHGTPVGGAKHEVHRFLGGRHALVPYPRQEDLGIVAEVCQSFIFDNGAFSVWKRGEVMDVEGFTRWVEDWYRHPGFDWALIPDVIEGAEADNDAMLRDWPDHLPGVPVWHLHESIERLVWLAEGWRIVAIGSSGQWGTPGERGWWQRMGKAMAAICDDQGRPACQFHGLRMLDPNVFTYLPLRSADSTNAGMNCGSLERFGTYKPPSSAQRAAVIAERIEQHNSSAIWTGGDQHSLEGMG